MRSGVLCFYRIGICIFLKRDSGLRRTSEEIFFLYTSNPSPKKLPYLRCLPYITNVTPRNATRHSRREVDIRFCFLFCQYFFQLPRPTGTSPYLIYDEQRERALPPISSTMSRGRGDLNLSSPRSVFSNPSVLRTPPLYFAMQNTEEEVNTFLCIVFVLLPCRVPQHCGVSHSGIGGVPEGRRKPPITVKEM